MYEFLIKTYTIVLPVILSYIVWLLQEQKKKAKQDAIERDERIKKEREMREANSKGTMLLLRVKLIEYHALGGNGMVTKMKNEIELLHLQSKEGS